MALTAPKRLRDAITKVCSVRVRSLGAIMTYLRAANAMDAAEWAVSRKRNKELEMEKSARSSCTTTHDPCHTLALRRLFFSLWGTASDVLSALSCFLFQITLAAHGPCKVHVPSREFEIENRKAQKRQQKTNDDNGGILFCTNLWAHPNLHTNHDL